MKEAVGENMILFRDMFRISSIKLRHTSLSEQCVVLFYGAMRTLCIYHMKFIKHFA